MKRNEYHHRDIWVVCLNCELEQINITSNNYGCKRCDYWFARYRDDEKGL